MARRKVDHLLIGGGLAAANCARWLREEGADGSVLLVGRELDPPYNRPPLSKGYLRGEESKEDVLFRPDEWWEEQDIELLTRTSVMKLDPDQRVVTLSTKDEVEFDTALLATGANVRRLRADGADLEGIHYLRAFGNSDAIRADAEQAERVVMIGGSYIGCEVAASLTASLGVKCSILMLEDVTFERSFGPEVGGFFHGGVGGARRRDRRWRRAGPLRGLRRARPARDHQGRAVARLRLCGRRRRCDARRDARSLGRARVGRGRRCALLGRPGELGAGTCSPRAT